MTEGVQLKRQKFGLVHPITYSPSSHVAGMAKRDEMTVFPGRFEKGAVVYVCAGRRSAAEPYQNRRNEHHEIWPVVK